MKRILGLYSWIFCLAGLLGFAYPLFYILQYEHTFEEIIIQRSKEYISKETRIFYDQYITQPDIKRVLDYVNGTYKIEEKIPTIVENVLREIDHPSQQTGQILEGFGLMKELGQIKEISHFIQQMEDYIRTTYFKIKYKTLWDLKAFLITGLVFCALMLAGMFFKTNPYLLSIPLLLFHGALVLVLVYVYQYAWFNDIIQNQYTYTYYFIGLGIILVLFISILMILKFIRTHQVQKITE